jgi:hypothetical protein
VPNTSFPRLTRSSAKWEPANPAIPVMRILIDVLS